VLIVKLKLCLNYRLFLLGRHLELGLWLLYRLRLSLLFDCGDFFFDGRHFLERSLCLGLCSGGKVGFFGRTLLFFGSSRIFLW